MLLIVQVHWAEHSHAGLHVSNAWDQGRLRPGVPHRRVFQSWLLASFCGRARSFRGWQLPSVTNLKTNSSKNQKDLCKVINSMNSTPGEYSKVINVISGFRKNHMLLLDLTKYVGKNSFSSSQKTNCGAYLIPNLLYITSLNGFRYNLYPESKMGQF